MRFSYKSYIDLLDNCRNSGYLFSLYTDDSANKKTFYLRHDVDFSIEKALEMAKLEHENNIKSTYFILLTSDFYNPFSLKSRTIIKKIQKLGHDIGLHFDETVYECNTNEDYLREINREIKIFNTNFDVVVKAVSMHRPSKKVLDMNLCIPSVVNTYSNKFFKETKYFSDSRMRWREDIYQGIKHNHESIQVLIHPFWYEDEDGDITSRLTNFVNQSRFERYDALNENFTDLEKDLPRTILKECKNDSE